MHPLDNPVWHALRGPQHTLAEGGGAATRYPTDVAPFAAVPDVPDAGSWVALRDLVGPGNLAVLFRGEVDPPEAWEVLTTWPTVQMLPTETETETETEIETETGTGAGAHADSDADGAPTPPDAPGGPAPALDRRWREVAASAPEELSLVELGADDVADMLALVGRTEPGPFAERTVELGPYLGVRDGDGTLVAMAGVRMHLHACREISAICTDAAWRARGMGTLLTARLATGIVDDGETPFLHALESNTGALRVYRALSFTIRRRMQVVALRAPQ